MMLTVELDHLNPRVRDIVETAIKEAKPFWLGFCSGNKELWSRRAIWMIEIDHHLFESGNSASWEVDHRVDVDSAVLGMNPNDVPILSGALIKTLRVVRYDRIECAIGAIRVTGPLPRVS